MKKLSFLLLTGLVTGLASYAQNNFPSSGDAKINAVVPTGHGGGYNALWMPNGTALMPENGSAYALISLTTNILRTSSNGWSFIDPNLPAWRVGLGHGPLTDWFVVSRSNPTTFSEKTLFKINNAGNVGIGTSTPKSLLEIRKDVQSGQGPVLELTNGMGQSGASTEIFFSTYDRGTTAPTARIKAADNQAWGANLYFDTKGNDLNAPLYTRMFIDGASGNVGIGTTNTGSSKFTVAGSGVVQNLSNMSDQDLNVKLSSPGAADKYALIAPSMSTNLALGVGGVEKMRITSSGSVVIGATDPKSYKLAVAGSAVAEEVNVRLKSEWADYVFKPTYRLPSLTQVKSYIDENKHLPDMPSAKEVAKEGVNLGEMVKLQTQKIEELTLYLIQQQKEIQQLKKQMQKLPKKRK
ncbi:hypothetical protein [Mucilaginibacter lacusdianchii]|uniref:hypothetical protein n=1 Tax=Mucilaginibacter lacusdianchii TaxID=2684211 RepID=UPI00131CBCDD|nr:hypothetical protein [Mucilaginibacter sp. JXJ CY 39]